MMLDKATAKFKKGQIVSAFGERRPDQPYSRGEIASLCLHTDLPANRNWCGSYYVNFRLDNGAQDTRRIMERDLTLVYTSEF